MMCSPFSVFAVPGYLSAWKDWLGQPGTGLAAFNATGRPL